MSWDIFVQVWVYSVVGFLIGILVTWLAWVRPLQRRLRDANTRQNAATAPRDHQRTAAGAAGAAGAVGVAGLAAAAGTAARTDDPTDTGSDTQRRVRNPGGSITVSTPVREPADRVDRPAARRAAPTERTGTDAPAREPAAPERRPRPPVPAETAEEQTLVFDFGGPHSSTQTRHFDDEDDDGRPWVPEVQIDPEDRLAGQLPRRARAAEPEPDRSGQPGMFEAAVPADAPAPPPAFTPADEPYPFTDDAPYPHAEPADDTRFADDSRYVSEPADDTDDGGESAQFAAGSAEWAPVSGYVPAEPSDWSSDRTGESRYTPSESAGLSDEDGYLLDDGAQVPGAFAGEPGEGVRTSSDAARHQASEWSPFEEAPHKRTASDRALPDEPEWQQPWQTPREDTTAQSPLPKRQPRDDSAGAYFSFLERADEPSGGNGAGDLFEPEPRSPEPRTEVPVGPFGPGSALPEPDGSAPSAEFTVKARTSSMVFHTEHSPFYERLLPQVWFRDAAEATRAGFTSWDRPDD